MIKTTGYKQQELLRDIVGLHLGGAVDLDPTYSKGVFYKNGVVPEPRLKFDLKPQTEDTQQASAESLPLSDSSVQSIVFDPPFIAGHTKDKPTGIIGQRFDGFRYVPDLWEWYTLCLAEFRRILKYEGKLVFKCQDTVSSGRQWFSHVHIINEAERLGFYTKDLFVLLARSRVIGHNHGNQRHARKFHSYFIVFEACF